MVFQKKLVQEQTVEAVNNYLKENPFDIIYPLKQPVETLLTPEEYPEYKQPLGAHDAYNTGDKVTFKGKKYECIKDNCVWDSETYPDGWKIVS